MKPYRTTGWRAYIAGAVSLCGVNVAEAAIATVDATITMDWSTLDDFVDWSWVYAFNAADASADGVVDSDYTSPDSDPAEANVGGFAVGSARTLNAGTTTPGPYARGHVAVDGIDALSAVASGTSHVGRAFTAKGSGLVVFEFDYLMSEFFDASAPGSNAGSYTLAELTLTSAPGAAAFAHAQAVRSWANGALSPDNDAPLDGILAFSFELAADSSYWLEAHVYSSANASTPAVPVPAALPMLGAALIGLGVWRRRALTAD